MMVLKSDISAFFSLSRISSPERPTSGPKSLSSGSTSEPPEWNSCNRESLNMDPSWRWSWFKLVRDSEDEMAGFFCGASRPSTDGLGGNAALVASPFAAWEEEDIAGTSITSFSCCVYCFFSSSAAPRIAIRFKVVVSRDGSISWRPFSMHESININRINVSFPSRLSSLRN